MSKTRKDPKGRALRKGELYRKNLNTYCYAYMDAFGKRRYVYAPDLIELRRKEDELEKNRLDKVDVYLLAKSDLNFVVDRYFETKINLRSTTKTNYMYMYDKFIRKGFGKRKIDSICFSDIILLYNSLVAQGLEVNTVTTIHSVLHPAFQMAVRDNIIRTNPTDGATAELKKNNKSGNVRNALTPEQEKSFLEYITQTQEELRWRPLLTVMFGTGCRIGEIIGLRWEDIDLDKRIISINHNLTYYPRVDNSSKCSFEISLPKTKSGIRTIPMLDKVYEAFLLEKELQHLFNDSCLEELDGMKNFIFGNRFRNLRTPASVNRALKRMISDYNAQEELKAKREKREPVMLPMFSCHTARHTFCSRLCENETNIKVIQTVMGHKDIQTTLDIYTEVSEKKKQDEFAKLNNSGVL